MHSAVTLSARHCDCGAVLPTVGTPANADGMALSVGEAPALVLVSCGNAVHGSARPTFALAVKVAA